MVYRIEEEVGATTFVVPEVDNMEVEVDAMLDVEVEESESNIIPSVPNVVKVINVLRKSVVFVMSRGSARLCNISVLGLL